MTISKDEFRDRFSTDQGRLELGYPHVDAAQAQAVVGNESMLQATYDGWLRAQESRTGQPGPYGQQPGPYGQQPGPYGQQPGPYGQQPGPYGQQPGPYGQQPGAYGQQQPGSYAQGPYGQAPNNQGPYGQAPYNAAPYNQDPYNQDPYGQRPFGGRRTGWYGRGWRGTGTPQSALGFAIAGIVLPIVLLGAHVVGSIGFVFGVIALRRSMALRRTLRPGVPGWGMTTTAFVLSIVAIVIGGLALLTFIVTAASR